MARVQASRSSAGAPSAPLSACFAVLNLGRERQKIERPRQRGGDRLVAGHDHGRGLVAQLRGRERLACLGVAGREEQVEQVARRSPARARLTPPSHETFEKRHPAAAEKAPGDIVRGRDADWQEHVEQVRAGEPDAVAPDPIAQRAAVRAHLQREHGSPGDLEREALNSREQVDGRAARGVEFGQKLFGWGEHVGNEQVRGLRRERRRERPALMAPVRPFAQKEPLAEQGAQDAKRRIGAGISLVVVHQHMPDSVRRVQDKARAAKKAPPENLLLIGRARVNRDAVRPHAPGQLERAHDVGRRLRRRRNETLRSR